MYNKNSYLILGIKKNFFRDNAIKNLLSLNSCLQQLEGKIIILKGGDEGEK